MTDNSRDETRSSSEYEHILDMLDQISSRHSNIEESLTSSSSPSRRKWSDIIQASTSVILLLMAITTTSVGFLISLRTDMTVLRDRVVRIEYDIKKLEETSNTRHTKLQTRVISHEKEINTELKEISRIVNQHEYKHATRIVDMEELKDRLKNLESKFLRLKDSIRLYLSNDSEYRDRRLNMDISE